MLERLWFEVMPIDLTAPEQSLSAAGRSGRAAAAEADVYARDFDAAFWAAWLPVFRFARDTLTWTNDWAAAEDRRSCAAGSRRQAELSAYA